MYVTICLDIYESPVQAIQNPPVLTDAHSCPAAFALSISSTKASAVMARMGMVLPSSLEREAYGSGRLIPVHLRHLNIHQDQGIVSRPAFTKEPDCLYSIYRCIQLQAESFQKFHGNFTVYFIILSQQDRDPGKIKGFRCLLCRVLYQTGTV